MKRRQAVAVIAVSVIFGSIATGIELANWQNRQSNPSFQVDASWIANVTQFLQEAKPYPEYKTDYTLNAYSINLFENGTSTFVNASNGNDFSGYLTNLLSRVNKQMTISTNDNFRERLLETDKVLELYCRLGTQFNQAGTFIRDAFFVLEDNSNQGLNGKILVDDVNGTGSWWAITR